MQSSYFLKFKDKFIIKEKKVDKIKVYRFWKLRFFYKFCLNVFKIKTRVHFPCVLIKNRKYLFYHTKNNSGFVLFIKKLSRKKNLNIKINSSVKSFFYKRMCRGQKLSSWLWYMFLQSFYGSFLETQFIYCIFGYFDIVSDNTSTFSEWFYPGLYFIFYFVFWKRFFIKNLMFFHNWLLGFFFIKRFSEFFYRASISFKSLFVEKKLITNFAKTPLIYARNQAFATSIVKNSILFFIKKFLILIKNLNGRISNK